MTAFCRGFSHLECLKVAVFCLRRRPAIAMVDYMRAYYARQNETHKQGLGMYKSFIALTASVLVAGPAAATDKTDVMSVVHQWVDSFNKGDMKSMGAACADQASIIDGLSAPRVERRGGMLQVVQ